MKQLVFYKTISVETSAVLLLLETEYCRFLKKNKHGMFAENHNVVSIICSTLYMGNLWNCTAYTALGISICHGIQFCVALQKVTKFIHATYVTTLSAFYRLLNISQFYHFSPKNVSWTGLSLLGFLFAVCLEDSCFAIRRL